MPSKIISLASTPQIDALLRAGAGVGIGVSGGKDSQAAALATIEYLDALGHTGPRVLIHSDLGMVEWVESLPVCEVLAAHLHTDLMVVRRAAGGLMERWESRWASSVRRYAALETVTLVLPWSTPSMRFCTSELKTQIIGPALRRRFAPLPFVSVTGVRREESAARAKLEVADPDARLARPGAEVWNWRPIIDWTVADVFGRIYADGLTPHRGYTEYGMSRIGCIFCIMSSQPDMVAAARNPAHGDLCRCMVALETRSTFAFQGNRWLADVAPDLLSALELAAVAEAKERAKARVAAERKVPKELLYVKGWPTRPVTDSEARLLASVRAEVCATVGIPGDYLEPDQIRQRYVDLIAMRQLREAGAKRATVHAPCILPVAAKIPPSSATLF
ncbi:MAG: phosphoadenosine phosphosulfate reductase domain-containing protein [Acidiferrobacterales bacterium]